MSKKIGRNQHCPCGSGKKYKHCCLKTKKAADSETNKDCSDEGVWVLPKDLPSISEPAHIQGYLDAVVASHPIFTLGRDEALMHVVRTAQLIDTLSVVENARASFFHGFYESMRELQDSLKYIIFKIFSLCRSEGNGATKTTPDDLSLASSALSEFRTFSSIHDALMSFKSGFLSCDVDPDERRTRFEYKDATIRKSVRSEMLHQNDLASQSNKGLAHERPSPEALEAAKAILGSLALNPNGDEFDYSISETTLRPLFEDARRAETESQLPEEWRVGPYSIGDHKRVWRYLRARSIAHSMVLTQLAVACGCPPPNGAELRMTRQQIVNDCGVLLGVNAKAVDAIVTDLIYDVAVPWTEVMYQPLLPIGKDVFVTCKPLIEGNRFERNLLAILDRLPNRESGAINLKEQREDVMIAEITAAAREYGINCLPRLKLETGSQLTTDIDLLLWNSTADRALALSLKWFYGPDSMQEVRNHDDRYKEAISIALRSTEFLSKHAVELSTKHDISQPFRHDTKFTPALITRVDLPSPLVDTSQCPTVTQEYLVNTLHQTKGDLGDLIALLPEPEPAVESASNVKEGEQELLFGDHRFSIPAVQVTWVDLVLERSRNRAAEWCRRIRTEVTGLWKQFFRRRH